MKQLHREGKDAGCILSLLLHLDLLYNIGSFFSRNFSRNGRETHCWLKVAVSFHRVSSVGLGLKMRQFRVCGATCTAGPTTGSVV